MAQSFAISVGNVSSYVAVSRGGGVEILLNEYSNRSTPTFVAFSDTHRLMGTEAAQYLLLNPKNTIFDLMKLIGKSYKEIDTSLYPFRIEEGENGKPLVVVRHLEEEKRFTITQVLAMLFTKLRGTAGNASECVISYPQFFDKGRREALIQSALIAGLKPLQVISDMSAIILNYAYYRTTKADPHKFIAFVNFGQSNLQTAVAWFTPKEDKVRVLAAESEPIGGIDFDRYLAKHFIDSRNLKLQPKPYLKLLSACEKLKRNLSAIPNEVPISVESLISDEQDFNARLDRATFEEMIQPILQQVQECFRRTIDNAITKFNQLMVERAETAKVEAARAEAAMIAVAKAKAAKAEAAKAEAAKAEAAKADAAKSEAAAAGGQEASQSEATDADTPMADAESPGGDEIPKSDSSNPEASKAQAENGAAKSNEASPQEASPKAKQVPLEEIIFNLEAVEMVGGSTRVPAVKQLIQNVFGIQPSSTLNTDEAVARGLVFHLATLNPNIKVKRLVKIEELDDTSSDKVKCDDHLRRVELELIAADLKYKARIEARNALEEHIYAERSKVKDEEQLLSLSNALDWLVGDDGENASEETYLEKLGELKKLTEVRDNPPPAPPSSS